MNQHRFPVPPCLAPLLMAACLLGCSGGPSGEEDPHDHDEHAHRAIEFTRYSPELEWFGEHPPAVLREEFGYVLHATVLDDGQPIKSGKLRLTLSHEIGEKLTVEADLARPGIFLPKLKLATLGRWQVTAHITSDQLSDGAESAELPAIEVEKPHDHDHSGEHGEEDGKGHDEHANQEDAPEEEAGVSLRKEQQWRIGLVTRMLRPEPISRNLSVPGRVAAPHPSQALVPPPVAGKVRAVSGGFPHLGDIVVKGQPLAVIEPSVLGAQAVSLVTQLAQLQSTAADLAARVLEAETRLEAARLEEKLAGENLQRIRKLVEDEDNFVAGKKLLQAESEADQATARRKGLEKLVERLKQSRSELEEMIKTLKRKRGEREGAAAPSVTLTAPITGTVVEAHATEGELVDSQHPLFRIVNLEQLFIEAHVLEFDLAKISLAKRASYRSSADPSKTVEIPLDPAENAVRVSNVVDERTRRTLARYLVPNPERKLRLGMYVDVLIEQERVEDALVVPMTAVADEGGQPIVFVQIGGESFEQRHVTLGIRDGDRVQIMDGVKAGERVVVRGAYELKLSTYTTAAPEHHHH